MLRDQHHVNRAIVGFSPELFLTSWQKHETVCQLSLYLNENVIPTRNFWDEVYFLTFSDLRMLKFTCLFLLALSITQVLSLECYTGYSIIKGQTVGTTTETCTQSSDQCYLAKAEVTTLNNFKLAGCSTFFCMVRTFFQLFIHDCIFSYLVTPAKTNR